MPRTVPEWIGHTDDTPVPPRVRLRVFNTYGRRCDLSAHGCGRIIHSGDKWTCDHIKPLIAGQGLNRESNLHPLCEWCDPRKTAIDVAEKSAVYTRALSHAGIKREAVGRPMVGTIKSGWKKHFNGGWERR